MRKTESELIAALIQDSHEAFDEIYSMYVHRLYAFVLQYVKQREVAEEIVQDVFVRLWQSRASIRSDESLKSFLFTIGRNMLINAYRRQVNSPLFEEYLEYSVASALSEDPLMHKMEYDDFLRQLRKAFAKLNATQRKVIELSKFRQLSNREIAEQLALSEQTVKNQLSLGLKALKSHLPADLLLCLIVLI